MSTSNTKPESATLAAARELAATYAHGVRRHFGSRLKRIRLFGSAARGDWLPESDIDLLVLLDEVTTADSEWLVREAFRIGVLSTGILLQPIPMTESHFQHLQARERRFALEVEAEGIDL